MTDPLTSPNLPIYQGAKTAPLPGPLLDQQAYGALKALNTLVPRTALLQQGYAHNEVEAAYADAIFLDQDVLHRFTYQAQGDQERHGYEPLPELIETYRPYILFERENKTAAHYDAKEYRYRLVQDERGLHLRQRDDLSFLLRPVDESGIPDFSRHLPRVGVEVVELFQEMNRPWWQRRVGVILIVLGVLMGIVLGEMLGLLPR